MVTRLLVANVSIQTPYVMGVSKQFVCCNPCTAQYNKINCTPVLPDRSRKTSTTAA